MTTERSPQRFGLAEVRVNGKLLWAVLACFLGAVTAAAQDGTVHWRHAGAMPPGAIGSQRLVGGGPLLLSIQPVEILAPKGALISVVDCGSFSAPSTAPLLAGMQIARVYRLRVTNIPGQPGLEVYPTIEVVDRLYPPSGERLRFPIPVELTEEELLLAAQGSFVTRVIYLENPNHAVATPEREGKQSWFEASAGQDPLVVADRLGRPVAILRLGGRLPDENADRDTFFYGSPPVIVYERGQ